MKPSENAWNFPPLPQRTGPPPTDTDEGQEERPNIDRKLNDIIDKKIIQLED